MSERLDRHQIAMVPEPDARLRHPLSRPGEVRIGSHMYQPARAPRPLDRRSKVGDDCVEALDEGQRFLPHASVVPILADRPQVVLPGSCERCPQTNDAGLHQMSPLSPESRTPMLTRDLAGAATDSSLPAQNPRHRVNARYLR